MLGGIIVRSTSKEDLELNVEQWFSNLNLHQNPQGGLLKPGSPAHPMSFLEARGEAQEFAFLIISPVLLLLLQRPLFENH